MSQDSERFLYFNVGLLKDSFALNALWQDALKYHLVDQPGKLIALRLTEYYEIMARGLLPPVANMAISATPQPVSTSDDKEEMVTISSPATNGVSPVSSPVDGFHIDDRNPLTTSPDVEQNAEAAADYWTLL